MNLKKFCVSNELVHLQLPSFWPARHFPEPSCDQAAAEGGAEEHQEEALRKLQRDNQLLLKEALERGRGWEEHPAPPDVELAFKKVDGKFFTRKMRWRGGAVTQRPPVVVSKLPFKRKEMSAATNKTYQNQFRAFKE